MKKLRVIQIGTKHDHAADTFLTLRHLPEIYEVVGWYEPDAAARAAAREKHHFRGACEFLSLDEVWSAADLDCVCVDTEEALLTRYALMAAECGYPVHMDKPGSPELTQFTMLIEICREKKLPFQIGYMYRYNAGVLRALELAKSGALGEIISVEAAMGSQHTPEKRQWLGQYKGGILYFLGCHLLDLVYLFQGQPEKIVPLTCSTGLDNVHTEDFGAAALCYKRGVSYVRASCVEIEGFSRRQLVVCGTKGTVEIHPMETYLGYEYGMECVVKESYADTPERNCKRKLPPFDRYKDMMIDFAAMVRREKENPFPPDYELAVQKLILDACEVTY